MKYYYKTTICFCPVCGKETKYRERVNTKPTAIELSEQYDFCED